CWIGAWRQEGERARIPVLAVVLSPADGAGDHVVQLAACLQHQDPAGLPCECGRSEDSLTFVSCRAPDGQALVIGANLEGTDRLEQDVDPGSPAGGASAEQQLAVADGVGPDREAAAR